MAVGGYVKIYSNDGTTLLFTSTNYYAVTDNFIVSETGVTIGSETYTYSGDKEFLGVTRTKNATEASYPIGTNTALGSFYFYIVEGEANTPTLTYDLSQLDLPEGTHSITVVAKADGYSNSAPSNAVEYVVEPSLPVWNGTDLTGTTWYVPSGWSATAGYGMFNITGKLNSYSFVYFCLGYRKNSSNPKNLVTNSNYLSFKTTSDGNYTSFNSETLGSFTITFTSGNHITSSNLISWLKQYGTLTSHTMA